MEIQSRKLALVLILGVCVQAATAQNAPAKDTAPKPPLSPSAALLASWNDIGRKLTAMAADFPEEKYDFRPNPAERTFAEQLLHAANANYFLIDPANGLKPPPAEDPKRSQYKSKAAVVEFVRKSFADGAAMIQSKGDNGLNDLIVDPFSNQQSRISEMTWGLIEHSGEHYGQLVVYYRVAGLVPPESRPAK